MLIHTLDLPTLIALEVHVIVMMVIGATGIIAHPEGCETTVVRNLVQNSVFGERIQCAIKCYPIVG